LISIIFDGKHKSSTLYEYDQKGNVLNSKSYDNDVLSVEKKFTYDYKNNKIQEIHLGRGQPGDTTSFRNNYIERTCTSYSSNSKGGSKTFYDKKGKEIKSETKFGILLYEYDKMGRVSKKTSLDTNGKMKFENSYKNTYDKKKNLIETIIQDSNGYYRKIVCKIEYNQ
jgi:YD repeat-containing protein